MDPVAGRGTCGGGVLAPLDCVDEIFGEESLHFGEYGDAVSPGAGSSAFYSPTVAHPRPRPQDIPYRLPVGGIIREMSMPASLSWCRYGSNDVLSGVSAGLASALRYELR